MTDQICPTCRYAMRCFGSLGNYWCPSCGTTVRVGGEVAGVPTVHGQYLAAAERVKQLERAIRHAAGFAESVMDIARGMGVAE